MQCVILHATSARMRSSLLSATLVLSLATSPVNVPRAWAASQDGADRQHLLELTREKIFAHLIYRPL